MQGRKDYTEKLFTSFQLFNWVPKENLYRRLRETLDLSFLYKDTKELYGKTAYFNGPFFNYKLIILPLANMLIQAKLRLLRYDRSYNQEDVARLVGISIHAYSKIETGITDLSYSRIEQLAALYELTPVQLLYPAHDPLKKTMPCC